MGTSYGQLSHLNQDPPAQSPNLKGCEALAGIDCKTQTLSVLRPHTKEEDPGSDRWQPY